MNTNKKAPTHEPRVGAAFPIFRTTELLHRLMRQTMHSPTIKQAIINIVSDQLAAGTPPEARGTYDRLIAAGFTAEEAHELIANTLASEIHRALSREKVFDIERYVECLARLPASLD